MVPVCITKFPVHLLAFFGLYTQNGEYPRGHSVLSVLH